VVRIGLTQPRVRLVRVVAPELFVIDGLDLLTALSTLACLHSTSRLDEPFCPVRYRRETRLDSIAGLVPDAAGGVFPYWHAFNHSPRRIAEQISRNGDNDRAHPPSESKFVQPMAGDRTESVTAHLVVLAVGGSAGSVQPLVEIVRGLPWDLPAAVLVTIHIGEQTRLPQILSRSGPLRATQARHSEVLEHGRIYVAPPGRHLSRRLGGDRVPAGRGWYAADCR
jgi:CheB methylesterase